ncbi:killer cell lectin-like receptor subfamily B member 1B allele B isoform X1 [Pipra filicauda]|uniref:Killer cell lectin-like receptor subfamily B member 1B allele B isoform X1 n=1 Tax=Pipra filicauda TaxID=649802 RepID=A0A6J2GRJ0_9PASS|nr:killer cell lectin-like receptor subfamily B member 1B allele B isoform X1 [Pipra filicauda]
MAGEIVYADLRNPGNGPSPAERCPAPAPCPWWHRVLLAAGALGHLVLLVLVVVLSARVFQGSPGPESDPRVEIQARNQTERCIFPSLVRYFCQPQGQSPPAPAGCKLCPQDWQLRGERCYWLSKESGSWTQGRKSCKDQGSELVVLKNETEMENVESVTDGSPRSVWVGLRSRQKEWMWVDDTPYDPQRFGDLPEVDEGCGALKGKSLEVDGCASDHTWVCQKTPFQLSSPTGGKLDDAST